MVDQSADGGDGHGLVEEDFIPCTEGTMDPAGTNEKALTTTPGIREHIGNEPSGRFPA